MAPWANTARFLRAGTLDREIEKEIVSEGEEVLFIRSRAGQPGQP